LATFLTADLNRVTSADLENNALTDGAFDLLARWPGCGRLARLDLRGNRFSPHLLSRLTDLPYSRLQDLSVGGNIQNFFELAGGEWQRFARSLLADQLTKLLVGRVRPGSAVARGLSSGHFPSLAHLTLWDVSLDPYDLAALIAAPWFRSLRSVSFMSNEFSDAHVDELLRAELREGGILHLSQTGISEAGNQKLRDHFGDRVSL